MILKEIDPFVPHECPAVHHQQANPAREAGMRAKDALEAETPPVADEETPTMADAETPVMHVESVSGSCEP